MEDTKKNDFIELKYTGKTNEKIFDTNVEEDMKQLDPKGKVEKTIIVIGQGMVMPGLDKALEGKELSKKYEITLSPKEGFGERKRELVKTIPLKAFTEQKVNPFPGMVLTLDNFLVRIIAVSGARVITDFNNPLAGKELHYIFTIERIITDDKEKAESLFKVFFKFVPEFEINEKLIIRGPKQFEPIVHAYQTKFKELLNKEAIFEEVKKPSIEDKIHDKNHEGKQDHPHKHP